MSARRQRISPALAGVIAAAVIAAIVFVMYLINVNYALPWSASHTVTVMTTDADGLTASSDVRIDGRLVGQVTRVESLGRQTAITATVDSSEWPLPAGTTASVRLATLLGQKYVQLDTSKPGGELPEKATIPNAQPVVDFDQVLNQFDVPTRQHLTSIIRTGGAAIQGTEATVQQLLPSLADLAQHSVIPTGELATRDDALNRILGNLAIASDQLAASRDSLVHVVDSFNSVTSALAQNRSSLEGFITSGDRITQTADRILGRGYGTKLGTDLVALDTAVHDLDNVFTPLYTPTLAFQRDGLKPMIDLIGRIGDADSQSDRDGYFLRQDLEGVDLSGIPVLGHCLSPTGEGGGVPGCPVSAGAVPTAPPKSPLCLPPVGGLALPGCPTGGSGGSALLPPPPLPPLPGGLGGSGGSCLLGALCVDYQPGPAGSTAVDTMSWMAAG